MIRSRGISRLGAVIVMLAVGLGTVACGTSDEAKAVKILRSRPDSEQALKKYNDVVERIKARLTNRKLAKGWTTSISFGHFTDCDEFALDGNFNATDAMTPTWTADNHISEKRRPEAMKIVQEVAGPAGFRIDPEGLNGPENLSLSGPDNSSLFFSAQSGVILYIRGGCHRIPGEPIEAP